MSDPIVELHDIGKILNKESIRDKHGNKIKMYGHSFLNIDKLQKVNTSIQIPHNRPLTWDIINYHHHGEVKNYNKDHETDISIPQMACCTDAKKRELYILPSSC